MNITNCKSLVLIDVNLQILSSHLELVEIVCVVTFSVGVGNQLNIPDVALKRSVGILTRWFYENRKFYYTLGKSSTWIFPNFPQLTAWVVKEIVENVHVSPVLRAVDSHFLFGEVHSEKQRGFIHRQTFVLEEAFVLMQVGVLSHRVGNSLVERQTELEVTQKVNK